MLHRKDHLETLTRLLQQFPIVGLIGARQVGKTTLAHALAAEWPTGATFFDLESPPDVARLEPASLALGSLTGLVVLDEIQNHSDLFRVQIGRAHV